MFDIRNYKKEKKEVNDDSKMFWTQTFIKEMDEKFPLINKECESLLAGMNSTTQDAFNNKVNAWGDFVETLQTLCRLYKVKDAKCLSNSDN